MEEKFDLDFSNEKPVGCIFCCEIFEVHKCYQIFLKHLLNIHKFIIGAPEEIADFRQYILYWKKLEFSHLEDYCIVYATNTENEAKESSEKFYLLCDKLPEDKRLRVSLQDLKLKYIMHQKEEECKNRSFSRPCIYCSSIIEDGVMKSFQHLISDHGFHIGKPENIIFGAKLLDLMDEMLKRLKCLYCEKTFKSHVILRQHMRKKQHRSLNPTNKMYDKFYIVNHLQPGVSWQQAKKEVTDGKDTSLPLTRMGREISVPWKMENESIQDVASDEDDETQWMDWRDEGESIPALCLFCPFTTSKVEFVFNHMERCHSFNFESFTKNFNFYSKVKLINFIRAQGRKLQCVGCDMTFCSADEFADHLRLCNYSFLRSVRFWEDSIYLIPVLEEDSLLIHIEDNDIDDEDTSSLASSYNEETVIQEDFELPSMVNAWKLHEELSEDAHVEAESSSEGLFFKCFFCRFFTNGSGGKSACIVHMNSMHNFRYNEAFRNMEEEDIKKAVNYIRTMTDVGKCFVCEKSFLKQVCLEDHRILEEHTNLPPIDAFARERWKENAIPNDAFLINVKHR